MNNFTPTRGIWETTKNAMGYVRHNMDVFWHVYKVYLPYIFGIYLLGLAATVAGFDFKGGQLTGLKVAELLAGYFTLCLTISWHRVVIMGPGRATIVNPLALQRGDWVFIGMGLAIYVPFILAFVLIAAMGAFMNATAAVVLGLVAAVLLIYYATRLYFYFPAIAAGSGITLKQAYKLSKGYVGALLGTNALLVLIAFIPITILMSISMIIGYVVGGRPPEGMPMSAMNYVGEFIGMLPMVLFFTPLLTAIGVTIISNFYLHAVSTRTVE